MFKNMQLNVLLGRGALKNRRVENLRIQLKEKERACSPFYMDPFKFVKGPFTKEKTC